MKLRIDLSGQLRGEKRGRTYRCGGGGGDSNAALIAQQARQDEIDRQARIKESQRLINRIFQGGPAEDYQVQTGMTPSTWVAPVTKAVVVPNTDYSGGHHTEMQT